MNCRYTDEELKEDVERTIGIRAKDIDEKIQFCGLWRGGFANATFLIGNCYYHFSHSISTILFL